MSRFMLIYLHPDLGEQRFELRQGVTYRLGSRSPADIVIPQRDVSRNHALLRVGDHALHITDLESKNGTYVNGRRVSSAEFLPGDRLQLSSAELTVLEVSSGSLALAEEAKPVGSEEGEPSSETETVQFRKASGPEDLTALIEGLADSLDHRSLSVLNQGVVRRFGLRCVLLFYHDPAGRLALVSSWGSLPDVGTFQDAFHDPLQQLIRHAGGAPYEVIRLSLGESVFLAAGLQDRHCLVLGCDDNIPAVNDLRAIVATFRIVVSILGSGGGKKGPQTETSSEKKGALTTILGDSKSIVTCRRLAAEFSKQDEPVLITGESGTGKELFARAIHRMSRRAAGPFVPVNCAAIPPDLTEAELFGVAPGVATGVSERLGRFHTARGGTLFLDEIGELPDQLQAKLLRVLESGEVYRVGDDAPTRCDVRIISATNQNIEEAVERGAFRADLFHRLHVLHLHIPPLRERSRDIPILLNAFLDETSRRMGKRVAGITVPALDVLKSWRWPGNVRELRSEVIRMVAMVTSGAVIDLDQVSPGFREDDSNREGADLESLMELTLSEARDELERRLILRVLEETGGNQSEAARRLGISRAGLFKKMRRLGI